MPTLSRVFQSLNSSPLNNLRSRHLPMINELSAELSNYYGSYNQIRRKKALMNWYKRIPELTAFINKVSTDSTSRWHFEPVKPNESGRNKVLKANRFSQETVLGKTNNSTMSDCLISGEGFGWLGFLKKEVMKQAARSYIIEKKSLSLKSRRRMIEEFYNYIETKQVEGISNLGGIDEDLLRPRKYRYLPSSTIEIKYNKYDIEFYRHIVGLSEEKFMPDEVVHYTLMERDGKVNGFTPVEAILLQLELLRQMWINMYSLHRNGGHPDKIFSLENVNPNTPAYQRIEEQLSKYKLAENKHGNMLWTGKLTVHDLQQLDGMQFKEQGLYITGLIAMQWGIPRSSIPYIISGTNTKDDTGGNTERGYWEVIRNIQETFAETQNTQLWIPHFGVKIVFENPYVNLDVQRETAMMTKLQNILSMDDILMKSGKQLSKDKRLRLLGLSEEDTEQSSFTETTAQGIGTQAQQSPDGVQKTDSQNNIANRKRTEQTNTISSRGKPTGFGKTDHYDGKIETKSTHNLD